MGTGIGTKTGMRTGKVYVKVTGKGTVMVMGRGTARQTTGRRGNVSSIGATPAGAPITAPPWAESANAASVPLLPRSLAPPSDISSSLPGWFAGSPSPSAIVIFR